MKAGERDTRLGSVQIHEADGCVEVVHHGLTTRDELEDVRGEIDLLLGKTGNTCVLIDSRDADLGLLRVVDTYEFSSTFPRRPRVRVAVVVAPTQADQSLFMETVARNRGTNIRVFFDLDKARRWLSSQ